MRKYGLAALIIGSVIISFSVGYLAGLTNPLNKAAVNNEKKPVIEIQANKSAVVTSDTRIIFEKEYLRCNHIVESEYPDQERLWGKNLEELKKQFGNPDSYSLKMESNTLIIRQKINDWCPSDKEKCRLGEYNGRVAIFKGADADHDVLLKVTEIKLDMLPPSLVEDIKQGKYEFANETELNDAMENLDEYL